MEKKHEKTCSTCKDAGQYPIPSKCWGTVGVLDECPHWEEKEES